LRAGAAGSDEAPSRRGESGDARSGWNGRRAGLVPDRIRRRGGRRWLLLSQATIGGGAWHLWGYNSFGLSLVPFIAGVGLLFFNGRSPLDWLLLDVDYEVGSWNAEADDPRGKDVELKIDRDTGKVIGKAKD